MTKRRLTWAAILGLLTAAAGAPVLATAPTQAATACTVNAILVNSCRPWFGATSDDYPQVSGAKQAQLEYFETRAGRPLDIAHGYHKADVTTLTDAEIHYAQRADTFLYLNWRVSESTWKKAAGGNAEMNARIDAMAASIKALGSKQIFLTLSHEPENHLKSDPNCPQLTFVGTSGSAEDYKAMWRNVRTRFDAAGVTNVVWVMNYMNYSPWDCVVNDVWPGNDLVDWVTFNAFQRGDHANDGVNYVSQVRHMYTLLTANSNAAHDYLSKPWGLAEWGIHHSGQPAAYRYYADAKAALESNTFPKLKMYLAFDQTNPNNGDGSLRVGYDNNGVADPAEQSAFNAFARSPALSGSWTYAGSGADTVAPTAPAGLRATAGKAQVSLSWTRSTDNVAVSAYYVLRGTIRVATLGPTAASYVDTGLTAGRTYSYRVRAVDAAGNTSPYSNTVSATPS